MSANKRSSKSGLKRDLRVKLLKKILYHKEQAMFEAMAIEEMLQARLQKEIYQTMVDQSYKEMVELFINDVDEIFQESDEENITASSKNTKKRKHEEDGNENKENQNKAKRLKKEEKQL